MKNICILSGIHRDAVIEIGEEPVTIGGDEDCAVMLSDSSARGAAIRVSLTQDGDVVATAERGAVSRGVRKLREGKRMTLAGGTFVDIGDVRMALGDDPAVAERAIGQASRRNAMLRWSGAAVVGVALIAVIGVVTSSADANTSAERAPISASLTQPLRDPVIALKREIDHADLSGVIAVDRDGSGRIAVVGAVDARERARWRDVVRWFDGRFGDVAALDVRLVERSDDIVLPFRIVSAHSAPTPRIVIQNGETFPVGSILPGGWEVRRIAGMTVVLVRGDRELAISF